MPQEIGFGEVYLPPLLIVATLALIMAWLTSILLNRLRWSRYFTFPTLVFLAIAAIYTIIIGTFVIQI